MKINGKEVSSTYIVHTPGGSATFWEGDKFGGVSLKHGLGDPQKL